MVDRDETISCRAGVDSDSAHGSVMPPLYLSANYSFADFNEKREYDYTRSGNPTRSTLADAIAKLEGGAGAVITSSGMSAVDLVLAQLPQDALVIATHDCYGGSWRLFEARARKGQIRIQYANLRDADAVGAALAQQPALLWIETPSNPLMRIADIASLAKRAKATGAKVAVDNTFLSPVLQKPIALGADYVVHSTTKYLNGHSDVVGGAVVAAAAADAEELRWWANCTGVTGAPFDSWLTLRGLRTLHVRLERQQATAARVAARLSELPSVAVVHYPGLETHPDHELAARQQSGFGAMLSFELAAGADIRTLTRNLRHFALAESLGGIESLIAHPATMTHAAMSPEARRAAGIGDNLLRVSVGLEHPDDLIADLELALSHAVARAR
ncbi:cystathionine gamma-synthase [Terricaulis silvestris]|uniref:Cystathionine gamma-synthase n=1 Tax=Terricaulis silvestris TaxID=2686094 RepID=A0A6I6MWT2_9CAUL|nr:cystathionine gamma-synthase [Terricaulis silvestris]QGZ96092.1 Cystathionine gamma-synthase [Terricaulis silvestris]